MTTTIPALGTAFQLGMVVRDIEAAMQHWIKAMGVGPFIYMEEPGPIKCTYRGKPTDAKISVAFTYTDNMQIELIQQRNTAPSPYMDFLASGREGLQHLAFYANDPEAAYRQMEANGLKLAYTIEPVGGTEQVRYYEDPKQVGTMTEIVPIHPARRRIHGAILAATKGWEGKNPIRRFKSIPHFAEVSGLI